MQSVRDAVEARLAGGTEDLPVMGQLVDVVQVCRKITSLKMSSLSPPYP